MNATAVLKRLSALGVMVTPTPHGTLYLEPASLIPPDLLELVRQHKSDILAYLQARTEVAPPDAAARQIAVCEHQALLAWASELAEQDRELAQPVQYVEALLRKVTTTRVSWYVSHYLKTIVTARLHQQHPKLCWGLWTPEWRRRA